MGPKETGFLYIRKEVQDRINPVFTFSGYQSYSASSGTRNVAQFITLGEILDWHESLGKKEIAATNQALAQKAYEQLIEMPSLKVISPREKGLRSAMISVDFKEQPKKDVFERLKSAGVIVKNLPMYNALRFSFHAFTTDTDTQRLLAGLRS